MIWLSKLDRKLGERLKLNGPDGNIHIPLILTSIKDREKHVAFILKHIVFEPSDKVQHKIVVDMNEDIS